MRLLQPLRYRPTALLWGGLSLSAIGDQLYIVALAWIATGVFGAAAGYLSAFQALVVILVAVLGGGWADRFSPLAAMMAADLARAAILLVAVSVSLVTGSPGAVGLTAVVLVLATGQAVFQPALQATLPGLVREPRLLPAANGLFDGTERSARLLGPGLVVLLAGTIAPIQFLTIDAATFLASAGALALIARSRLPGLPAGTAPTAGGRLTGIRIGVRAMRRHPILGYDLTWTGAVNGAWYAAYFLCLPLLLKQEDIHLPSGDGLQAYGMLISLYGCTNVAANIVCGSRAMPVRPQVQIFAGRIVVGLGTVGFAALGTLSPEWRLPAAMTAAMLSGIGGPMGDIPIAVLRQSRIPRGEIAAAMRAKLAMSSAGVLVAMLVLPSLLTSVPLSVAIAACGAVPVAVGLAGLFRYPDWREVETAPA